MARITVAKREFDDALDMDQEHLVSLDETYPDGNRVYELEASLANDADELSNPLFYLINKESQNETCQ